MTKGHKTNGNAGNVVAENKRVVLSRTAILEADDLKPEWCDVPEWGGGCYVKRLTGIERDRFEASQVKGEGTKAKVDVENLRARLVVITAMDDDGRLLFAPEDAKALGGKSAMAIARIDEVARRINGMSGTEVEEAEKNSVTTRGDDSISRSRDTSEKQSANSSVQ